MRRRALTTSQTAIGLESIRRRLIGGLAILGLLLAGPHTRADEAAAKDTSAWKYVVPVAGEAFEHAPLRAVSLRGCDFFSVVPGGL